MLFYSLTCYIRIHYNIIFVIILLLMNYFLSHCTDNEYSLLKILAHCIPPSLVFHCKDFDRASRTARSAVILCRSCYDSQNKDWIGWNLLLCLLEWHL